MTETGTPRSTAKIAGRPIHPMTVSLPITLLIITCVCDIAFFVSDAPSFATVSLYALGLGILFSALAAVFGFIDYLGSSRIKSLRAANIHMIGNVTILLLSIFNFLIRGGSDAEVPTASLVISIVVFIAIHITGWMGWTMVYRHGVGVDPRAGEPH